MNSASDRSFILPGFHRPERKLKLMLLVNILSDDFQVKPPDIAIERQLKFIIIFHSPSKGGPREHNGEGKGVVIT